MRVLQQHIAERKRAQRAAAGVASAGRAADGGGADVAGPTAACAASSADAAAGRPAAKRARREPYPAEVSALRRAEQQRGMTGQGLVPSAAAEPDLAEVAAARRAMQDFRGSFAGVGSIPGLEHQAAAGQGLGDVPMQGSRSRGAGSTAREPAALEPWEGADPGRLHEDRRGRAHEAAYSNGVASRAAGRSPAADDGGGSTGVLPFRMARRFN